MSQQNLLQDHPSHDDSQEDEIQASVKVVRDTEFINEFRRRANDDFWKTIDCIQTTVKAKTGIGHPIFYPFFAPLNDEDPSKEIDYSHFKNMADENELIKEEEDIVYCQK